jgi:hypothetical protein
MHGALSLTRLVATCVLVAALPAAVVLPPLAGLTGLVVILAALIGGRDHSECADPTQSARHIARQTGTRSINHPM